MAKNDETDFGYAYDHRTTSGDPTVESAWTICTLSAALSWLDPCVSVNTHASTHTGTHKNRQNTNTHAHTMRSRMGFDPRFGDA